jgi:hypothetical protein
VKKFIARGGVRVEKRGGKTIVHTTKIMDWFEDDFPGGALPFLRRYLTIPGERVSIFYDDHDWDLNDRR